MDLTRPIQIAGAFFLEHSQLGPSAEVERRSVFEMIYNL
jgi:hypothetical protein